MESAAGGRERDRRRASRPAAVVVPKVVVLFLLLYPIIKRADGGGPGGCNYGGLRPRSENVGLLSLSLFYFENASCGLGRTTTVRRRLHVNKDRDTVIRWAIER